MRYLAGAFFSPGNTLNGSRLDKKGSGEWFDGTLLDGGAGNFFEGLELRGTKGKCDMCLTTSAKE